MLVSPMKLFAAIVMAMPALCEDDGMLNARGEVMRYENGTVVKRSDTYCAFYHDAACTQQSGSVHYDVENGGCFFNFGRYIWCWSGSDHAFHLIQSPNNDDNCNCQTACTGWTSGDLNKCWDLDSYVKPPYGTYRFVNNGNGCPGNNC